MAWRYRTDDDRVIVVLDPHLEGLVDLAIGAPVWLIDTESAREKIRHAEVLVQASELFEMTPVSVKEGGASALKEILPLLDEEYGAYRHLEVHGLERDLKAISELLDREGFRVDSVRKSKVTATLLPEQRGKIIGRDYLDPRLK